MIQNQLDTKIKRFKSDNAKEYFSGQVTTYFERHGIMHQSSWVNTPQQNGLAERRIRLVLVIARALFFQGKVPKYLWEEAVITTTHLLNRIPSKVLGYQSPLSQLSVQYPTVQLRTGLPAIVFGSLCYVHT